MGKNESRPSPKNTKFKQLELMTYKLFFSGVGGAILGSLISTLLAYWFQSIQHKKQMEAQKLSQAAFLASLGKISEAFSSASQGIKGQLGQELHLLTEAVKGLKLK